MPSLRLELEFESDQERLLEVAPYLQRYLGDATAEALSMIDSSGVSLKIVYAPGVNIPRIDVYAEVSEGKTPEQDMKNWLAALKKEWIRMRKRRDLAEVMDILCGRVGFWTGIRKDGVYEELFPVV